MLASASNFKLDRFGKTKLNRDVYPVLALVWSFRGWSDLRCGGVVKVSYGNEGGRENYWSEWLRQVRVLS